MSQNRAARVRADRLVKQLDRDGRLIIRIRIIRSRSGAWVIKSSGSPSVGRSSWTMPAVSSGN